MLDPAAFCDELLRLGAGFFTGVPDTVTRALANRLLERPPPDGHVIAPNEGSAVGLAAGRYLATGRIPVVYMQNSGLGNAVNPLLSLADREVYAIPMLLLVGWRGRPGHPDEPQHLKQGRITSALLDAMEIPHAVLGPDPETAARELAAAFAAMRAVPRPRALLVEPGAFPKGAPLAGGFPGAVFRREDAIRVILREEGPEAVVVATTGMGGRELYEAREALGQPHDRDFLNVGAMGHASMIALGIALARPERRVVCLDGDGALFMHLGALALVPTLAGPNLVHVLVNNGMHESVGGQPTLAGRVRPASLARDCGYSFVRTVGDADALGRALAECRGGAGPAFIEIETAAGYRPDLGRPGIPLAEAGRSLGAFLAGGE